MHVSRIGICSLTYIVTGYSLLPSPFFHHRRLISPVKNPPNMQPMNPNPLNLISLKINQLEDALLSHCFGPSK